MFDFFKKKTSTRLGLDIGTSAFKAVQVETMEKGGRLLQNYGLLDLFFSARQEPMVVCESTENFSEDRLTGLLKGFVKKAGFTAKEVVLSVPVFSSFFTSIRLPIMSQEELEKAIRYEAKKYVPLPLEEVELDWSVNNPQALQAKTSVKLKKSNVSLYGSLDILLVAVPKVLVQRLIRVVTGLNLKLVALEAETFSLARALQYQADSLWFKIQERQKGQTQQKKPELKSYFILDAGARSTSLIWVQGNSLRLVHFIDYSGNRVSNFLSEKHHLSFGEIEKAKRSQIIQKPVSQGQGLDFTLGDSEAQELTSIFEKIIIEIKAVTASISKTTLGPSRQAVMASPQFCLVSGGSVYLKNFLPYLESNLDMPVIRANPFLGLSKPANLEPILEQIGPMVSIGVGLALR